LLTNAQRFPSRWHTARLTSAGGLRVGTEDVRVDRGRSVAPSFFRSRSATSSVSARSTIAACRHWEGMAKKILCALSFAQVSALAVKRTS
jgi:hypothetical protein